LSYIFAKHKKYEVALKYGEKAQSCVNNGKFSNPLHTALIHTVLAYAYMNVNKKMAKNRCELAKNSLDQHDRDCKLSTNFEDNKFIVQLLAEVLYQLREYDCLMDLCKLCNYQFSQIYVKNHFLSFEWKLNLSKCLFDTGFYLQAIKHTEEVEDSFEDEFFFFKNFKKLYEVQSCLPKQLSKLGFDQKAIEFYDDVLSKFKILQDKEVDLDQNSKNRNVFQLQDYTLDMIVARLKFEVGRLKS
jgi:tetratricopeptide (TPR) repeat protein